MMNFKKTTFIAVIAISFLTTYFACTVEDHNIEKGDFICKNNEDCISGSSSCFGYSEKLNKLGKCMVTQEIPKCTDLDGDSLYAPYPPKVYDTNDLPNNPCPNLINEESFLDFDDEDPKVTNPIVNKEEEICDGKKNDIISKCQADEILKDDKCVPLPFTCYGETNKHGGICKPQNIICKNGKPFDEIENKELIEEELCPEKIDEVPVKQLIVTDIKRELEEINRKLKEINLTSEEKERLKNRKNIYCKKTNDAYKNYECSDDSNFKAKEQVIRNLCENKDPNKECVPDELCGIKSRRYSDFLNKKHIDERDYVKAENSNLACDFLGGNYDNCRCIGKTKCENDKKSCINLIGEDLYDSNTSNKDAKKPNSEYLMNCAKK